MEDLAFGSIIKNMDTIKEQIKELETQKEKLRIQILTELKIRDLTNYEIDDRIVELKLCSRKNFEKEKAIEFIKNTGADTSNFFSETSFETLTIKQANTKEEQAKTKEE